MKDEKGAANIEIDVANSNTQIFFQGTEIERKRCAVHYNFEENKMTTGKYSD